MINPDAIVGFRYDGSNFTLTKADGSTVIHPYSDKFHQFTGGGLKQLGTIVGLEEAATAIGTFGPDGNKNPGSAGTFVVPAITVDKYGRTTSVFNRTITMPAATSVSLNGSSTTSASFYAPTTAGTDGQVLKSNGSGAPTWTTLGSNAFNSTAYLPLAGGTMTGTITIPATSGTRLLWGQATDINPTYNIPWYSLSFYNDGQAENVLGLANFWGINFITGGDSSVNLYHNGNQILNASNYSSYALPISGGSMQGQIWFNGDSSYPGIWFRNPDNNKNIGAVYMNPTANNYMHIRWARDDGGGDGYYYLNGSSVDGTVSAPTFQGNHVAGSTTSTVYTHVRVARLGSDNATYSIGSLYVTQAGTSVRLDVATNGTTVGTANFGTNFSHTGTITGSKVYGAVWNDYAEYRFQNEELKPGYITYCDDDGKLKYTTERLQKFEGVVSDTFGFAIGETDDCKTPLAVSGRALVYCNPEDDFHSGDCVCAGPDGLAYRMTREEIIQFPDRIVGIVSEIPTYETWGTGNVEVNGRIWIKVR